MERTGESADMGLFLNTETSVCTEVDVLISVHSCVWTDLGDIYVVRTDA